MKNGDDSLFAHDWRYKQWWESGMYQLIDKGHHRYHDSYYPFLFMLFMFGIEVEKK
jgi:hypothetical protein